MGALTGIGSTPAFAFAEAGVNVVASGRNEKKGKALAKELGALRVEADYILPVFEMRKMSEICQRNGIQKHSSLLSDKSNNLSIRRVKNGSE